MNRGNSLLLVFLDTVLDTQIFRLNTFEKWFWVQLIVIFFFECV